MAAYFKYLPLFLAIIAVQYLKVHADDDGEIKTTWEVIKEVDDCKVKSKKFDKVTMHYVGRVTGTDEIFDNSYQRNEPFSFQIGFGEVIKGWDVGLINMCVGEKRRLNIPASEGYGAEGAGDGRIKPNTDLTFDVELLKIEEGEAPPDVFGMMDTDDNRKLDKTEIFNFLKERAKTYGMEGDEFDYQHREVVNNMLDHEDKNKDGFITHKEFSGPKHPPTERDEL